ncbi:MAG: selenocysteine-specific translation elongation factor [Candidatus Neomarinimicrobiota bacterium]|nr:selenocysteine-specific translation elongation factor [Candidatus Neomarinimicrobiota bacterium]
MSHVVIGTAGHIDHGKTSLVKALTGTDTDRLIDEKKRGMTIDLGFAFLNDNITIIDMPGHEKFVRNMVAGVSNIHIVLLVVAVDDGIMPQTKEHLQILQILNISTCIIVLTKIDLIKDEEWVDLVELEVREMTRNTFENIEIVRTSVQTNEGIDQLKNLLLNQIAFKNDIKKNDIFRLHVDRSFSMMGFGTVVTGTVLSGELNKGDKIFVLPDNISTNVRGIQRHGEEINTVRIGDRAAINLANIELNRVFRGSQLTSSSSTISVNQFIASITITNQVIKEIKHRQRVRIHLGTAEVFARIYLIGKKTLNHNVRTNVLVKMEKNLCVFQEDLFVIRSYSPITTLGGGIILTTLIIKNLPFKSWVPLLEREPIKRFNQLINYSIPKLIEEWSSITQVHITDIFKWIKDLGLFISENGFVYTEDKKKESIQNIIRILQSFHDDNPLRNGMVSEVLKQQSRIEEGWFLEILSMIEKEGLIKRLGSEYALTSHEIKISDEMINLYEKLEKKIIQNGFIPITTKEISGKFELSEKKCLELLHVLKNQKKLVKVNIDLWMHTKNIDRLYLLNKNHFQSNNELDISSFKSYTGLTRKFAIPVLEFCDKQGWTSRMGNLRIKGENL